MTFQQLALFEEAVTQTPKPFRVWIAAYPQGRARIIPPDAPEKRQVFLDTATQHGYEPQEDGTVVTVWNEAAWQRGLAEIELTEEAETFIAALPLDTTPARMYMGDDEAFPQPPQHAAPPAPDEPAADDYPEADGWTVISRYTRAEALADGTLVDVSETAREAGFVWPVAVTAEVWVLIEQIPDQYSWEDVQGRLWDVLYMLYVAIKSSKRRGGPNDVVVKKNAVETHYRLTLHHYTQAAAPFEAHNVEDEVVLKAVSGPGDHGEPVITIMRTWES